MKNIIYDIKAEANTLRQNNDEELKAKMLKLKKRAKTENINNLLVECFALVQEVSFRQIGLRHFDTQLLAGAILHDGKIVEMKT